MASIITYLKLRRRDSAMDISCTDVDPSKPSQRDSDSVLEMKSLGVCIGSGLNRLTCALVQYTQDAPHAPLRLQVLQSSNIPILSTARLSILKALCDAHSQPSAIALFNAQLGKLFADGIRTFCDRHDITLESIEFIGAHSATVPARRRSDEGHGSALQLFNWIATIAEETKITTIFDYAVIEKLAIQPLASPIAFVNKLFLRHPSKFRACLNISELANINFIPPLNDSSGHITMSRDCGPGSLLIDYAMAYCTSNDHCEDDNGAYATKGKINQDIVDRFLRSHDYLRDLPPLIIAREMFGDHDGQRLLDECILMDICAEDTIATITRVTAQNIVIQYRRLLAHYFPSGQQVDELFLCGASARNANIVDHLKAQLPESIITKLLDDIGIPGEANEAICYAHLALETALAQATQPPPSFTSINGSIPSSSASDAHIRATIMRGHGWEDISARIVRFSGGKQLQLTKEIQCNGNLDTAMQELKLS
ncbi:hypothetical protein LEMA_P096880.1 [Plenodomus lingam JN3]|uniref:Uncharacterized protein n=1 Tax=Leptosphaeria maculans (strain JN3 / isolate v23.1.3 / race Av1-4-5-6-7-8) TaxID=985895 RepID=E5A3R6_LEPMJ|nr:hypothetical protein LEMA_P096880.1 [Plenodomus lingam JN3]CBX98279.1 hypothetical protein LEMA_P096880.1 [Plenodomus lingam JN3]